MATVTVIPPEPAAPLMAGLGAVAGVVGLNSQIVSGAYYAYHGNWDPLGKSAVGWGISKLNPLGKDTQPVWDRTVNLDSSKNDVKNSAVLSKNMSLKFKRTFIALSVAIGPLFILYVQIYHSFRMNNDISIFVFALSVILAIYSMIFQIWLISVLFRNRNM